MINDKRGDWRPRRFELHAKLFFQRLLQGGPLEQSIRQRLFVYGSLWLPRLRRPVELEIHGFTKAGPIHDRAIRVTQQTDSEPLHGDISPPQPDIVFGRPLSAWVYVGQSCRRKVEVARRRPDI